MRLYTEILAARLDFDCMCTRAKRRSALAMGNVALTTNAGIFISMKHAHQGWMHRNIFLYHGPPIFQFFLSW
jgi:hypothetical protein